MRYFIILVLLCVELVGQSFDAFGRLRSSSTGQRIDVEFIYDKQEEFFDEIVNNGTVTHNTNTRDLTLSLSDGNNGSYAAMASHPIPYTPGNSQLIELTGVLDFADIGGGTAEVFLRSSVTGSIVEQVVEQKDWGIRRLDVDWSTSQIFSIDFQSLKVGSIRFSLAQNCSIEKVAQIDNDNIRNGGYWQLPSLPIYWKLYTTGGFTYAEVGYGNDDNAVGFRYKIAANASATMKAICGTVKSEGGDSLRDLAGLPRSVNRGTTAKTVSTTLVPIISIRPRTTFNSFDNLALAIPKSFNIQATEAILVKVIHDGVLGSASWANVDTLESTLEYDISATTITNGHVLASEYIYATSSGPASTRSVAALASLLGKTVLWNRKGSETGIFTIAAQRTGGTDSSVLGSISWEEIR